MATLTTKRGDTFRRVFTYADGSGAPLDLTDCTARFAAKAKGETSIAFCAPTIGDHVGGTLTINAAEGLVTVVMPPTIMDDIEPGTYLADIRMTFANGDVVSTETFSIKVIADITP